MIWLLVGILIGICICVFVLLRWIQKIERDFHG